MLSAFPHYDFFHREIGFPKFQDMHVKMNNMFNGFLYWKQIKLRLN